MVEQRLPRAVFRLEAPHALSGLFAAFGTKIFATHHTGRRRAPMFDVCTRALTFGPGHKSLPNSYCSAYVQVDGKLFFLDTGSFEMLDPPPPLPDDSLGNIMVVWKWENLPEPPFFSSYYMVSHAVHPDERTIFFSTEKRTQKRAKVASFSFDTESCEWTRRGEWRLPFKGRGYFDPELDAWVGLSDHLDTIGHLCACEVVSAADANGPPVWKLSKDQLFCVDPTEKHIGATLVYMGGRSKFCLVETLSIDDRGDDIWEDLVPERLRYLLRVTTFFLKYDKNGDLRTAKHRRVRSYRLPKIATRYCDHLEKPVAFWI
uniref:F-box associated domain-containing protein n=1 Tax=Arundo donax TaxID=35708 RepID=A0A0A8ZF03_ARUDO